jgi:hypothetical protein
VRPVSVEHGGVTPGVPAHPDSLLLHSFRGRFWLALLASLLLVTPCVWHRRIEAGDLGSHTYNAWLAQLIEKGQAPGLLTVRQWDNVLVDLALFRATRTFGFAAGEKIVVAACALLFFWSVFAFVAAVSGRAPWLLAPAIAMLSYGYAFNLGFLNYCVSLGLACAGLALIWQRHAAANWLACAALTFFAMLAHPIGLLFLLGMVAYRFSREMLPDRMKWIVPLAAIGGFAVLRLVLMYQHAWQVDWTREEPFYFYSGADQLIVYGERYATLSLAAVLFGVACFVAGLAFRRKQPFSRHFFLALELYGVAFFAIALLPENLRPSAASGWIGLLVSRLTVVTAIFGLCVLASLRPRIWQFAGFSALALVFFSFLYADTGWLNRLESNAENALAALPPGTRVVPTIVPPRDWRAQFIGHLADRACIGRCFAYSNYEPPTAQFRVRVSPQGSPLVTNSNDDSEDMAGGDYEVQDTDPPLKQLYQCDVHDLTKLCLHDLQPGETTGAHILHLP